MEEVEIVEQILDFAATIDFTTTREENSEISVFESNIRYLGGLISGKMFSRWHPIYREEWAADVCRQLTTS